MPLFCPTRLPTHAMAGRQFSWWHRATLAYWFGWSDSA